MHLGPGLGLFKQKYVFLLTSSARLFCPWKGNSPRSQCRRHIVFYRIISLKISDFSVVIAAKECILFLI